MHVRGIPGSSGFNDLKFPKQQQAATCWMFILKASALAQYRRWRAEDQTAELQSRLEEEYVHEEAWRHLVSEPAGDTPLLCQWSWFGG